MKQNPKKGVLFIKIKINFYALIYRIMIYVYIHKFPIIRKLGQQWTRKNNPCNVNKSMMGLD